MLSDTAGMASKSYLRYLILILIAFLASARTPPMPMVDNLEASLPPHFRLMSTGGGGKVNIGGDAPNLPASVPSPMIPDSVPLASPMISDSVPLASPIFSDSVPLASPIFSDSVPLASPMSYGGGGKPVPPPDHFLPNPSLASIGGGGKMNVGWSASQSEDDVNGKLKQDTIDQPASIASMAIGLIPIIPGGNGGAFQFGVGPIDFGFNFGWGGLTPGYLVSYSNQPEPYVIVSPYSSPYPMPSPYLPPGAGYGTARQMPSQGYAEPYPPSPANSARMGGTASKPKND